jgi:dipeptidyl-peptidase III
MKKTILSMIFASTAAMGATAQTADNFKYNDEKFADIQMLRYKVEGFDKLTLKEKTFIYYLQEAALQGRDILFDQNGRYNLRIRRMLEAVYTHYAGNKNDKFYKGLTTYLKRVWFSSGIYHHYGCEKFQPEFGAADFRAALKQVPVAELPLADGQTVDQLCDEVFPVIFDPTVMPMRVNQKDGDDLIQTSACNYYEPGITQAEAEEFYSQRKPTADPRPIMMGMNSRLERNEYGLLTERVWRVGGMYTEAIERIVDNLLKARPYADTPDQQKVIDLLVETYRTGDLRTFDDYSIHWLKDTKSLVDFTNYFTESYGDPLGMKASWEAIVNFKDLAATERTEKLSANAQWFEDHSPVAPEFKKDKVKGMGYLFVLLFCALELIPWTILLNVKRT